MATKTHITIQDSNGDTINLMSAKAQDTRFAHINNYPTGAETFAQFLAQPVGYVKHFAEGDRIVSTYTNANKTNFLSLFNLTYSSKLPTGQRADRLEVGYDWFSAEGSFRHRVVYQVARRNEDPSNTNNTKTITIQAGTTTIFTETVTGTNEFTLVGDIQNFTKIFDIPTDFIRTTEFFTIRTTGGDDARNLWNGNPPEQGDLDALAPWALVNATHTNSSEDLDKAKQNLIEQINTLLRTHQIDITMLAREIDLANDFSFNLFRNVEQMQLDGPYDTTSAIPTPYSTLKIYLVGTSSPYQLWAYIDGALKQLGSTTVDISTKVDKVSGATQDNIASFVTGGNIKDSGIPATGLLHTSDVINNVTSTDTDKPLSANAGRALQANIDNLARVQFFDMNNLGTRYLVSNETLGNYTVIAFELHKSNDGSYRCISCRRNGTTQAIYNQDVLWNGIGSDNVYLGIDSAGHIVFECGTDGVSAGNGLRLYSKNSNFTFTATNTTPTGYTQGGSLRINQRVTAAQLATARSITSNLDNATQVTTNPTFNGSANIGLANIVTLTEGNTSNGTTPPDSRIYAIKAILQKLIDCELWDRNRAKFFNSWSDDETQRAIIEVGFPGYGTCGIEVSSTMYGETRIKIRQPGFSFDEDDLIPIRYLDLKTFDTPRKEFINEIRISAINNAVFNIGGDLTYQPHHIKANIDFQTITQLTIPQNGEVTLFETSQFVSIEQGLCHLMPSMQDQPQDDIHYLVTRYIPNGTKTVIRISNPSPNVITLSTGSYTLFIDAFVSAIEND